YPHTTHEAIEYQKQDAIFTLRLRAPKKRDACSETFSKWQHLTKTRRKEVGERAAKAAVRVIEMEYLQAAKLFNVHKSTVFDSQFETMATQASII
ncbi:hypothetical protein HHI36_002847, partial [Cryptolaemus montrouzieri]